jgi:hypothetical protein
MADERQDVAALRAVQDEIKQGRIRVYRNALNQPYVFCDHPECPGLNVPLFHRDFRGWLCRFAWNQKQLLLHEREVDRILELLSGQSLENPIANVSDPALLQLLEKEPLLATIVEFMEGRDEFETTVAELLRSLRKFASERGLLGRMASRFPGGPNVLSKKLSHFSSDLALFGITVAIRRSNGAKVKMTGRKDDDSGQSSGESSAPNRTTTKDLSALDDRTRRLQELADRKHHPKPNENSN